MSPVSLAFALKVVASAAPLLAAAVAPLPTTTPTPGAMLALPPELLAFAAQPAVVAGIALASSYVASGDTKATAIAVGMLALAAALYRDRAQKNRAEDEDTASPPPAF